MKKKILFLLFFFTISFFLLIYNNKLKNIILTKIAIPIKISYHNFIENFEEFFHQKEELARCKKKVIKLQKKLDINTYFLKQTSEILKILPSLKKKPYKSIYLVQTISYVKLNKLNEIMLTKPKIKLQKNKLYGLIQEDYAAGVAEYKDGNLYGYLLSNPKCTFSVKIGKNIPGVAQGDGAYGLIVKFIPRWSKIHIGDKVTTSGLDNIFFPDITVGKITDIKILDRYKEAKVKIAANLFEPKLFFFISNAAPYLTTDYKPENAFPGRIYPFVQIEQNNSTETNATQTVDEIINPTPIKEQNYLQLYNYFWQQKMLENNLSFKTDNKNFH